VSRRDIIRRYRPRDRAADVATCLDWWYRHGLFGRGSAAILGALDPSPPCSSSWWCGHLRSLSSRLSLARFDRNRRGTRPVPARFLQLVVWPPSFVRHGLFGRGSAAIVRSLVPVPIMQVDGDTVASVHGRDTIQGTGRLDAAHHASGRRQCGVGLQTRHDPEDRWSGCSPA